jgi:pimeloyl-ACP methyl ester carboxylesterase
VESAGAAANDADALRVDLRALDQISIALERASHMRQDRSEFLGIRGLRYHCRIWGPPGAPMLLMLHGWMDVSASFQFLVDALGADWQVIAPDWRGFGLTEWAGADAYWFNDYLADLDALLEHFSPHAPVNLVGHSMGGNVACLYAGVRPGRVRRLVNLEGFGLRDAPPDEAPERLARWLDELGAAAPFRDYPDFAALAARLRRNNPRLRPDRADFLARHWGEQRPGDPVRLRSDPAHRRVNPVLYRLAEAQACWARVSAPVLWVEGAQTGAPDHLGLDRAALDARRGLFGDLRWVRIEQAGHMLHHDQPEALAAVLEPFLRGD